MSGVAIASEVVEVVESVPGPGPEQEPERERTVPELEAAAE